VGCAHPAVEVDGAAGVAMSTRNGSRTLIANRALTVLEGTESTLHLTLREVVAS
jgi:hypothetical protein